MTDEALDGAVAIHRAVRRSMRRELVLGVVLAFLAAFAVAIPDPAVAGALSGLFGLVAVLLFYRVWQERDLAHSTIISLLNQERDRVVWVYAVATQNMPFGVRVFSYANIYLNLEDGKAESLMLPRHSLDLAMTYLKQQLPHATFGYSDDNRLFFQSDPEMLRRG